MQRSEYTFEFQVWHFRFFTSVPTPQQFLFSSPLQHGLVEMRSLTIRTLSLARLAATTRPRTFFPTAFDRSSRDKKLRSRPSSACAAGLRLHRRSPAGWSGASRPQWVRLEVKGTAKMAKIGSFTKISGELRGQIITLSIQAQSVRIVADEQASGNAPSHRVYAGEAEVGAAWSKRTSDDRPYLSIKLDDPSFTAPIFAQLFSGEDGEYDLVWSRQTRRDRD